MSRRRVRWREQPAPSWPRLNRFSIFGGHGSDSAYRTELSHMAIEKAAQLHAVLAPDQVYVTGNPHDIEAAKAAGAISVGVAHRQVFRQGTSAAG